jgi:PTS system nitrogen regulatory IIA component
MPNMLTQNDIVFSDVHFAIKGDNAAQIVKNMSWLIGRPQNIPTLKIYNALDDILKTSIVGIGDGVTVFDWTSEQINTPYLLCATLETPVNFPSVDERASDIVLALISPAIYGPLHLQYLSRITRMFRDTALLHSIRNVTCVDGLNSILSAENRKILAA